MLDSVYKQDCLDRNVVSSYSFLFLIKDNDELPIGFISIEYTYEFYFKKEMESFIWKHQLSTSKKIKKYKIIMSGTLEQMGNTFIYSADPTTVTQDELQEVIEEIVTVEDRVIGLENKQTLFIDYWQINEPLSPLDGDIWFDDDNIILYAYNNDIWLTIPFSTDSVYVDRNTNQQYAWNGSIFVSMTVPLTKSAIESLIYSDRLLLAGTEINLAVAEIFDRFETPLTGATTFTITNPKKYKGFRLKLKGGTLNTDLFNGYTENWILTSLITDYNPLVANYLVCEIRR